METGTGFQPILIDHSTDKLRAKRVVLLSGKIYYEALKERQSRNLNDSVALVRIEELAPFPFKELEEALSFYPNATEYMWLQEEPRNQGTYLHVADRILSVLQRMQKKVRLEYVGRKESSIPAPGVSKLIPSSAKEGSGGGIHLSLTTYHNPKFICQIAKMILHKCSI
jgi:probable 2-oxoglutarate dehydrogenase E1 component DHKTD1